MELVQPNEYGNNPYVLLSQVKITFIPWIISLTSKLVNDIGEDTVQFLPINSMVSNKNNSNCW